MSFTILKSATEATRARLGRLTCKDRRAIETPHYIGITSRGVIPHLSQDTMARKTHLRGVYIALEDCKPHPTSQPHHRANSSLTKPTSHRASHLAQDTTTPASDKHLHALSPPQLHRPPLRPAPHPRRPPHPPSPIPALKHPNRNLNLHIRRVQHAQRAGLRLRRPQAQARHPRGNGRHTLRMQARPAAHRENEQPHGAARAGGDIGDGRGRFEHASGSDLRAGTAG